MSDGIRRRSLSHPDALSDRDAGREALVRAKFDRGEPLDSAEKAFLADLPARQEISPEEIQRVAAAHGGATPIDAKTGGAKELTSPSRSR